MPETGVLAAKRIVSFKHATAIIKGLALKRHNIKFDWYFELDELQNSEKILKEILDDSFKRCSIDNTLVRAYSEYPSGTELFLLKVFRQNRNK